MQETENNEAMQKNKSQLSQVHYNLLFSKSRHMKNWKKAVMSESLVDDQKIKKPFMSAEYICRTRHKFANLLRKQQVEVCIQK